MKRCDTCGIRLTGPLEKCPLCHGPLAGDEAPSAFPENTLRKTGTRALALLALITLLAFVGAAVAGNVLALESRTVLVICLALGLNYLFVRNIIMHTPDFLRSVIRYFLVLLAIAAIWFALTGDAVITTFVIPLICLTALVFDTVLVLSFRESFVSGYAKYLLYDIVLGIGSLIPVFAGATTWYAPAAASALAACILAVVMALATRKQLAAEMRKLFSF